MIRRVAAAFGLLAFFLYDLIVSSLRVAWDVLTPAQRARPAVLQVPLDAKGDIEILLTANLISLTPGTLSLDVSRDRSTLLVHSMFAGRDFEGTRRSLKDGMERKVLEASR